MTNTKRVSLDELLTSWLALYVKRVFRSTGSHKRSSLLGYSK